MGRPLAGAVSCQPPAPPCSQRGGLASIYSSSASFSGCTISGCLAQNGGVLFVDSGTFDVADCHFLSNSASVDGAVLYFMTGDTNLPRFANVTLTGNHGPSVLLTQLPMQWSCQVLHPGPHFPPSDKMHVGTHSCPSSSP